jgi:hypothetical protein
MGRDSRMDVWKKGCLFTFAPISLWSQYTVGSFNVHHANMVYLKHKDTASNIFLNENIH